MKQEYTDLPEEVVELLNMNADFITILEYEVKAKEILRKLESTKGSWLTERPTEPGCYWIKQYQYRRIVHLWRGGTSQMMYANEYGGTSLEDPMYDNALWWSEPIVEPE